MIAILRFIVLPAGIILAVVWWLVLKHTGATLLPFLAITAALLLGVRLITGRSPLGSSSPLAVWFVVLAWLQPRWCVPFGAYRRTIKQPFSEHNLAIA